jgi:hypothetical protein
MLTIQYGTTAVNTSQIDIEDAIARCHARMGPAPAGNGKTNPSYRKLSTQAIDMK